MNKREKMLERVSALTKKILWAFGIIFVIRCAISFSEIRDAFSVYLIFSLIGEAISITTVIAALYERFLWTFDKSANVPVIKGKYEGSIVSSWDGKKREAKLEIKQTLLKLSITMKTDESISGSITASIDEIHGEKQLTYCYLNKPMASVRNRSEIHYGTAMLNCDSRGKLIGTYFTDRKTTGDMLFERVGNLR